MDLPDIDESSKDVYETSDIESVNDVSVPGSPELSFKDVSKRFDQSVIVDTTVDFLGKVSGTLGRTGYIVEGVEETPEQKLARIARELEELKAQNLSQASHLENVLVTIKGRSDHNLYGEKVDAMLKNAALEFTLVDRTTLPPPSTTTIGDILKLESRLSDVEKLIGAEKDHPVSIQTSLNDLRRRINIIHNPEYHIQQIKHEITKLAEETEKLEARRKVLEITSEENHKQPINLNISDIHAKLHEIDEINQIVPMLITRLKTLHLVHSDISNAVKVVSDLDETLDGIKTDMSRWDCSINTLNQNITEYEDNFEINKKIIMDRMESLERRLDEE